MTGEALPSATLWGRRCYALNSAIVESRAERLSAIIESIPRARQITPFFRIVGYGGRAREAASGPRGAGPSSSRKRRNEKSVEVLKKNASAKSSDFVPDDFNGLPFRFVSLGEMTASFGAPNSRKTAPLCSSRREIA
jgi:hypothetical protein